MNFDDLKYVWMGVMLFLLASNADAFLHSEHQQSQYSAPWVHPANESSAHSVMLR